MGTRQAWAWLLGQRGTGTPVVGGAGITPDREYPADWTGPVSGTVLGLGAAPPPDGWVVAALVTTDVTYLLDTGPVVGGRFSFPDSRPGTKTFQLVDPRDGRILAESAPDVGLLRSFVGSERTYPYDQALAVLAALALDRPAPTRTWTGGLLTLQAGDGGFVEVAAARNPAAAAPVVRTGISAIATYALLAVLPTVGPDEPFAVRVAAAARAGVAWLRAQEHVGGPTVGLLGAGRGERRPDGSVDPTAVPPWVSTEHNLDAWHTLRLAADVLQDPAAGAAADRVRDALLGTLWTGERFLQGWNNSGPDDADPLDVSSWGALFLHAVGRDDLAARAVAHVARFDVTDAGVVGQRAWYPQPAYPAAPTVVWFEGTAGVGLARWRTGDAAGHAATLDALTAAQSPDGGFRYATREDAATGMTTAESVAATAWYVLAAVAPTGPSIWD